MLNGARIVAIILSIVSLPLRSHAQVSDAVYEDAKAVISELISREISTSVVPNLVCLSGYREVPNGEHEYVLNPKDLVKPDPGSTEPVAKETPVAFEATAHFPRTLQRLFDRQFGSLEQTLRSEAADAVGYAFYTALSPGSMDQLGVEGLRIQGLLGEPRENESKESESDDADEAPAAPVGKIVFTPMPEEQQYRCAKGIREAFERRDYLSRVESRLRKECPATTRSARCNISLAVAAAIDDRRPETKEFLVRAVAAVIVEKIAIPSKRDAAFAPIFNSLRQFLFDHRDLGRFFNEVLTITKDYDLRPGTTPTIEIIEELLAAARALRDSWQMLTSNGNPEVRLGTFVETFVTTNGAIVALCENRTGGSCAELKRLNDTKLAKLVALAQRADRREIAAFAVEGIFQHASICKDPGCEVNLYRNFASSVAMYILDASAGTPSEATREAFRDSAVKVITTVKGPQGMDRGYLGWVNVLPDLALRLSWNGAYDEGRTVASANTVNLRGRVRYTRFSYLALQLSAVDLLAPVAEVALRDSNAEYDSQSKLSWNLLTPRFDILFGVPALSKHLVIAAGGSLRLTVPYDTTPTPDDPRSLQYRLLWDENVEPLEHVEVSVAVKYLL